MRKEKKEKFFKNAILTLFSNNTFILKIGHKLISNLAKIVHYKSAPHQRL